MLSSIDRIRHDQIWDLLHEYADIRDQLEALFDALHLLQQSLEVELEDLSEDFDDLQERLNRTAMHLFRFKVTPNDTEPVRELPFETTQTEPEDPPFPFLNDPQPEPPVSWSPDQKPSEGGAQTWN